MNPFITRSLVAIGLSSALATAAMAHDGQVYDQFVLTEHVTSFTPLDLGAPGTSLGDQFVGTGDLFDAGGNKVGTSAFHCLSVGPGVSQCAQVYELARGKITTSGTTRPNFTTSPFFDERLAITGGTGDYRIAAGELRLVQHSFTDATLTVFLAR